MTILSGSVTPGPLSPSSPPSPSPPICVRHTPLSFYPGPSLFLLVSTGSSSPLSTGVLSSVRGRSVSKPCVVSPTAPLCVSVCLLVVVRSLSLPPPLFPLSPLFLWCLCSLPLPPFGPLDLILFLSCAFQGWVRDTGGGSGCRERREVPFGTPRT